ncbi:Putative protein in type-1 retrotransposable element R1DM [Araneus ventricosus]|uniref:Reverse transcriptase domain-containing protein n=1 Tax=Araneus ventricosus TaxID=182803 RepID=A0A4Y2B1D1_ARAVE|nr:Putative protein in type-1 retrotransposable element R1DM [Araneus ventricosus]
MNKFVLNFKKRFKKLCNNLDNLNDIASLEEYFVDLLESVCGTAFKSFKKKPKGKKRGYTFWCDDLRNSRNSTNVLYKKYQGFMRNNSPEDVIQEAGAEYRKSRAQYKRFLLRTKHKAWEDYCGNYTEKCGGIFRMVFKKSNKVNNILINPENDQNLSFKDRIKILMKHFFPNNDSYIGDIYTPSVESVEELNYKEIDLVVYNLKKGKAPGLDQLDYKIWTAIHGFNKNFLTRIFNLCLKFNYFPECLRKAKIFLQKSGKDTKSCDAYRPFCLLPTIGKILERVFQNRFNKYLSLNNIIHRNQKGFREGTGCDRALDNIVNKIRETRSNQNCALISLDIKAAFDNME